MEGKKHHGFTIVELLIVIVIIAILAAISIVAYSGIQNRAKASAGQSLASQIAKKVEIYNTATSTYPSYAQITANPSIVLEAQLDNPSAVVGYSGSSASPSWPNLAANYSDNTKVIYRLHSPNGGCVYWWDFAASVPIQKNIPFGVGGC